MLIEWDPSIKGKMESASNRGVLLVRYQRCPDERNTMTMEMLEYCEVGAGYELDGVAHKQQSEKIRSADGVYAKFKLGAFNLVGEFKDGDEWSLDYVVSGMRYATVKSVRRAALKGGCAKATHFVSAMSIGAYRLHKTAWRGANGEIVVFGQGGGGGGGGEAASLSEDGTYDACVGNANALNEKNCQAIVRLFLEPLEQGEGGEGKPYNLWDEKNISVIDPARKTADLQYKDDLKKAWATLRKPVKGATTAHQLERYQAFLTAFAVENPYEARARKEIEKLNAKIAMEVDDAARAAKKVTRQAAQKARAEEIRRAHEAARADYGSADACLRAWESFAESYPGKDNPYLATARREIKRLRAEVAKVRAQEDQAEATNSSATSVKWIFSFPAGVSFTESEVTVAQFGACVKDGACSADGVDVPLWGLREQPQLAALCNWGREDRDNHPMNCLDMSQALAICDWLGGRLPTEEEWLAEATNDGEWPWPWGQSPQVSCDYAVWDDGQNPDGCGRDGTWPVCSKTNGNSVSGLCDMCGNVWEWTSSVYDNESEWRVARGGSWSYVLPGGVRESNRAGNETTLRGFGLGVRCAR